MLLAAILTLGINIEIDLGALIRRHENKTPAATCGIKVVDDDSSVTTGLAMLLERKGCTIILCADIESAELILGQYPITQISHAFGTAFDEDPMRTRVVRHIVALARDFACRTIVEGIEAASTARAAAAHGIDLAQGYHIGRPREASHWIDIAHVAA